MVILRKHYVLIMLVLLMCVPFAAFAADKPNPNMLRADERDHIAGGGGGAGVAPYDLHSFQVLYARYVEAQWDGRVPIDPGSPDGADYRGEGGNVDGDAPNLRGPGFDARGPGFDARGPGFDVNDPGADFRGPDYDARGPGHDGSHPGADLRGEGGDASGAKETKVGFVNWLIGGAGKALDAGWNLWNNTADKLKSGLKYAFGAAVDTMKTAAKAVAGAAGKAIEWTKNNWEFALVTTAGVALTVAGAFFPPLLPFGVAILAGEAISGGSGYAFGLRGQELLREMAIGGALSLAGMGAGALIGRAASAVARMKPIAGLISKGSNLVSRGTQALKGVARQGMQVFSEAAKWVKQTPVARAVANLGTKAGNAARAVQAAERQAGNAVRSNVANALKQTGKSLRGVGASTAQRIGSAYRADTSRMQQAGGAIRAAAARAAQTRLGQALSAAVRGAGTASSVVRSSKPVQAMANLVRQGGKSGGSLASRAASTVRTVTQRAGSKISSAVQAVVRSAPVRSVVAISRQVGQQVNKLGGAVSRALATTVMRSKAAGAAEGFTASVADDKMRGQKVDYRKAVIAATIGAVLVTGASLGSKTNPVPVNQTVQAAVSNSAEQVKPVAVSPQVLSQAQAGDNIGVRLRTEGTEQGSDLYRRTANIGAFKDLAVPMQLKEVEKIASQAGIGLQGIKVRIIRDPELVGKGLYGWADPKGKVIELYPDAFTDTENLVKTLGHERTHIYQTKTFGTPNSDTLMDYEKGAYGSEESWWLYYQKNGK